MKNIQNLRVVFVQMLFALAIGQVALKTGDLVNHDDSILNSFRNYYYIYSHMLLCVVILSTSWVGWQISQSTGNTERINSVFSWPYGILLIDIFLVISYFIIVRGGEIDVNHKTVTPSAYIETLWSMIIFITYFLWDLITKLRTIEFQKNEDGTYYRNLKINFEDMSKRSWQTLLCVIISICIYNTMSTSIDAFKVTITDLTLITLFLLFRSLKQDIKKSYKLSEDQIPDSIKEKYSLKQYPIIVVDKNYGIKRFFVKYLLFIFLIVLFVFYYKL